MSAVEPSAAVGPAASALPPIAAADFLVEAGEVLTSSLDFERTIESLSRLVVPAVADCCIVYLVSDDGSARTIASVHVDPRKDALLQDLHRRWPPDPRRPNSLMAHAFTAGEPLVVSPVTDEWISRLAPAPEQARLIREIGPQSLVVAPLPGRDRMLGTISFSMTTAGRTFDRQWIGVLGDLGRWAAMAIENARLHTEVRREHAAMIETEERLEQLQTLTAALADTLTIEDVGRVATEQCARVLRANNSIFARLDTSGDALECLVGQTDGDGPARVWSSLSLAAPTPLATAVRDDRPIFLQSWAEVLDAFPAMGERLHQPGQSLACLPLTTGGERGGGLALGFTQPRAFTDADRSMFVALAQQCAQALRRAELHEHLRYTLAEAEQGAARTARLQAVTAGLSAALTPEQVAEVIVQASIAAAGVQAGAVYAFDAGSDSLVLLGQAGYRTAGSRYQRVSARQPSPLRDALRLGRPVVVSSADEMLARWPSMVLVQAETGDQAFITLPLVVEERSLGVLHLASREPRTFPPEEQDLLYAIARQCAQALERSRLYAAEQAARAAAEAATRRLQLLAEASERLAGSLDYHEALDQVARLAVSAFADVCFVDLVEVGASPWHTVAHAIPEQEGHVRELRHRFPVADNERHPVNRALATGQPYLLETVDAPFVHLARSDRADEALLSALRARSAIVVPLQSRGRVFGALSFVITASEQRYDEHDLRLAEDLARRCAVAIDNAGLYEAQQEAIRARDQFLSVAAHELKTPITSLRGFAQLVLRQFNSERRPDRSQLQRALEIIDLQASKLARLLSQLLDVSRLNANRLDLERETTNLAALTEAVIATYRAAALDYEVVLDAPARVNALVDPIRIEQVLTNLLDNAVKFSPSHSTVRVQVGQSEDGTAFVSVTDKGIGVPVEHRDRIFDRFYQAHADAHTSGMGLGLYIGRQIVELHGGRLEAEFPDDGGARFTIRVPAAH